MIRSILKLSILRAAIKAVPIAAASPVVDIRRQREQRIILPVHVVLEIENSLKPGAGDLRFVSAAVGFLAAEEKTQAALNAAPVEIATGADAHHGPGSLRRGAFAFAFELARVVGGARFAPAAIFDTRELKGKGE